MKIGKNIMTDDYVDKLVAFVDILGFRNHVFEGRDKAEDKISLIDGILSHTLNVIKEQNAENVFSFKLFSDCICLSVELVKTYEMLYELAFMQAWFSINGIFLRGALSHGLHYENERMIFSEGLIRAYEFEKNAIYPRITIDPVVFNSISDSSCLDYLMKAPDGVVFVDYLSSFSQEGISDPDELIEKHKNCVVDQAKKNAGSNTILEKFRWLSGYHNMKAAEHLGSPDDWEESYYKDLQAKLLIPMTEYFPSFEKPEKSKNDQKEPQLTRSTDSR